MKKTHTKKTISIRRVLVATRLSGCAFFQTGYDIGFATGSAVKITEGYQPEDLKTGLTVAYKVLCLVIDGADDSLLDDLVQKEIAKISAGEDTGAVRVISLQAYQYFKGKITQATASMSKEETMVWLAQYQQGIADSLKMYETE